MGAATRHQASRDAGMEGPPAATAAQQVAAEPGVPESRALFVVGRAVAVHPALWGVGLRMLVRLARPRWWRHRPFLPVPDAAYWRFRMETAYGGDGSKVPQPHDAVAYLHWCRRMRGVRG